MKLIGRDLRTALTPQQSKQKPMKPEARESNGVADRKETHNNFSHKADLIRKPNWLTMIMVDGCGVQLQSIPRPRVRQSEIGPGTSGNDHDSSLCHPEYIEIGVRKVLFSDAVFIKPASQVKASY